MKLEVCKPQLSDFVNRGPTLDLIVLGGGEIWKICLDLAQWAQWHWSPPKLGGLRRLRPFKFQPWVTFAGSVRTPLFDLGKQAPQPVHLLQDGTQLQKCFTSSHPTVDLSAPNTTLSSYVSHLLPTFSHDLSIWRQSVVQQLSKTYWKPMMKPTGWGPPVISGFINHYNPY